MDERVLEEPDLKECWDYINTTIQEGTKLFIPKVVINSKKKLQPKWMNMDIKRTIKRKYCLFKKYLESKNSWDYHLYISKLGMKHHEQLKRQRGTMKGYCI